MEEGRGGVCTVLHVVVPHIMPAQHKIIALLLHTFSIEQQQQRHCWTDWRPRVEREMGVVRRNWSDNPICKYTREHSRSPHTHTHTQMHSIGAIDQIIAIRIYHGSFFVVVTCWSRTRFFFFILKMTSCIFADYVGCFLK